MYTKLIKTPEPARAIPTKREERNPYPIASGKPPKKAPKAFPMLKLDWPSDEPSISASLLFLIKSICNGEARASAADKEKKTKKPNA